MSTTYPQISEMIGKVFTEVTASNDTLTFKCAEGIYTFLHEQDCCEDVSIEDICGDLQDLVGVPLLIADESTSGEQINGKPGNAESFTWTFYKFATVRGYVDVRWFGESNGYYSESVNLKFTPKQ